MSAQQSLLEKFTKENFDDLKKNAPEVIISFHVYRILEKDY